MMDHQGLLLLLISATILFKIIVMNRYILIVLFINSCLAQPLNFKQSTRLAEIIYYDNKKEVYCGCDYLNKNTNLASCGYKVRKQEKRAKRIEWEHVVPASVFGRQLQCWQKGRRKYCKKYSDKFNKMEADLHNLLPVIGEINSDRNDFQYAWLPTTPYQYGECQTVVDFKRRKIMPRKEARGIIARISLYIYEKYNLRLSDNDKKLFEAWNKAYPVTKWEKVRNQRISCITGTVNNYVSSVDFGECRPNDKDNELIDWGK